MANLKISLYRFGTLVFGQVIEQDESLRVSDMTVVDKIVDGPNDFDITSDAYPSLDYRTLNVRGRARELDNKVFCHDCADVDQAIELTNNIREAVDIANINVPTGTYEIKQIL